jgi:hypothetical protein
MKNKEIDLTKLLKGCEGQTFWCKIHGEVILKGIIIDDYYPLRFTQNCTILTYTKLGMILDTHVEPSLIPSREIRTWEGWKPPCRFKEGELVALWDNGKSVPFIQFYHSSTSNLYNNICKISEIGQHFKIND